MAEAMTPSEKTVTDGQIGNMIVRRVRVNRSRGSQELLDATNRRQDIDHKVVESMPKGVGKEVDVVYFKLEPWEYTSPGFISDDDLEKAFKRRGLKHDPLAIIVSTLADPAFSDECPLGTHWKDKGGNWCYAQFHRQPGVREVNVGWSAGVWDCDRWFAGVSKSEQTGE